MLLVNALKSVCDMLCLFSIATLFLEYSESWLLMAAVVVLAFAASLILQKTKRTVPAKLLCGLLPALSLFAARSVTDVQVTSVILAVHLVLTLSGKSEICYEDYKYWFGIPAVPVLAVFVICFTQWPIRPETTLCAGLYLFLGVLVLRRKRMGAGAGPRLRLVNLAELVGVLVICVLLCVLVFLFLRYSGKILEVLLFPLAWLLNALVFLLDGFIGLFPQLPPEETLIPEETESAVREGVAAAEEMVTNRDNDEAFTQAEQVVRILAIVLVLAILVFLLYRLYRMLRNVRKEENGGAAAIEGGKADPLRLGRILRSKRNRAPAPSNNRKIRQIYREYLSFVKARGVEVTRHTTSEDVMTASGAIAAREDASQLRALYIRARYRDADELGDEEVRQAEALLLRIMEQIQAEAAARKASPAE